MEANSNSPYQDTLAITTRNGAITAAIFHTFFVVLYTLGGYPSITTGINLFCLLIDMLFLLLTPKYGNHKPIAHLITFSVYLSLFGPALFSGGIAASCMVWLTFLPEAATIIAGREAGIYWGIISIVSVIGAHILKESMGGDFSLIPVTNFDRLIDIASATLATTAAIWLSEVAKSRVLNQLEHARTRLDHLATIDSLTNTYNRRYFIERAHNEIFQSQLAALLLFDIYLARS